MQPTILNRSKACFVFFFVVCVVNPEVPSELRYFLRVAKVPCSAAPLIKQAFCQAPPLVLPQAPPLALAVIQSL